MVHALRDIWRVLVADGTLVDLRPLPSPCPLEAVTPDTVVPLGEADGTEMVADDAAADAAMRQVVGDGWFVPRRATRFDFELCWDSAPEMSSFIEGSRRMKRVDPSYRELENIRRSLGEAGAKVRLRCRRPTLLAAYGKAVP